MRYQITVIVPAASDEDHNDTSLQECCEEIILIDSPKERTPEDMNELAGKTNRPPFFIGTWRLQSGVGRRLPVPLCPKSYSAILAEYAMMGQYLEGAKELIPPDTMTIISVHECYTQAFRQRVGKGERISDETTQELFEYGFRMYRAADRVLLLTREDMEVLVSRASDLPGRISVVPHGVDSEFYTAPKRPRQTRNIRFRGNFNIIPMLIRCKTS